MILKSIIPTVMVIIIIYYFNFWSKKYASVYSPKRTPEWYHKPIKDPLA